MDRLIGQLINGNDWEYSSVVKSLYSIHETLNPVPSTSKERQTPKKLVHKTLSLGYRKLPGWALGTEFDTLFSGSCYSPVSPQGDVSN